MTALVATGSGMFVFGLAVSAAFAAEWRLLHVLQAMIYVVLVTLARRKSAWGFGAGFFVALFWNSLSLRVTTVRDNGVGVPQEQREQLFQLFFRAHGATVTGAEGTGLGLNIVRETAESLGGRAWAEFPEDATIFAFSLPYRRGTSVDKITG